MKLSTLPKALVFDLDGTLAHTLPQLSMATNDTLRELGIRELPLDVVGSYVGNGVNYLISRSIKNDFACSPDDLDPELMRRAREIFNRCYKNILDTNFRVFDGVSDGLAYFRSRGIVLLVLTNKAHYFARPLLGFMGIDSYFDEIMGSEVIKERKPDPAPLLYLLERHNLKPGECVMVGDSMNDLQCARNAGACSVIFTYGYHGSTDIRQCGADYVFDTFGELTDLIRGIN